MNTVEKPDTCPIKAGMCMEMMCPILNGNPNFYVCLSCVDCMRKVEAKARLAKVGLT